MKTSYAAAVALALTAVACGPDKSQVQGQLPGASKDTRLALVFTASDTAKQAGKSWVVVQEVPAAFDAQGRLTASLPAPAADALTEVNVPNVPHYRIATGLLLAYDDKDHDGALAIGKPGVAYPDQPLAALGPTADRLYQLVYLDATSTLDGYPPGYSFVFTDIQGYSKQATALPTPVTPGSATPQQLLPLLCERPSTCGN